MTGDAERAGTAGWAALSVARETGSVLVTDQLRRLAPWHDQPALAGLLKAIDRAR